MILRDGNPFLNTSSFLTTVESICPNHKWVGENTAIIVLEREYLQDEGKSALEHTVINAKLIYRFAT